MAHASTNVSPGTPGLNRGPSGMEGPPKASDPADPALKRTPHLGVLCQFQGIIDLNAEVPHGALELGVTQQELDCTQVLGPPIDQRRLRAAHRVCLVVSPHTPDDAPICGAKVAIQL